MPNIEQLDIELQNPNPLFTIYYRDVRPPNRFENLGDSCLNDFLPFLTKYYRNHEIVGNTEADFFTNLQIAWYFQRGKFLKYKKIIEIVTPEWGRHERSTSDTVGDGNSSNSNKNSEIAVTTSSDPQNDVPTSTNYSENKYKNKVNNNTHLLINDGNVNELNEFLKKQKTLEAYLVDIFDGCFIKGEIYGY